MQPIFVRCCCFVLCALPYANLVLSFFGGVIPPCQSVSARQPSSPLFSTEVCFQQMDFPIITITIIVSMIPLFFTCLKDLFSSQEMEKNTLTIPLSDEMALNAWTKTLQVWCCSKRFFFSSVILFGWEPRGGNWMGGLEIVSYSRFLRHIFIIQVISTVFCTKIKLLTDWAYVFVFYVEQGCCDIKISRYNNTFVTARYLLQYLKKNKKPYIDWVESAIRVC